MGQYILVVLKQPFPLTYEYENDCSKNIKKPIRTNETSCFFIFEGGGRQEKGVSQADFKQPLQEGILHRATTYPPLALHKLAAFLIFV